MEIQLDPLCSFDWTQPLTSHLIHFLMSFVHYPKTIERGEYFLFLGQNKIVLLLRTALYSTPDSNVYIYAPEL